MALRKYTVIWRISGLSARKENPKSEGSSETCIPPPMSSFSRATGQEWQEDSPLLSLLMNLHQKWSVIWPPGLAPWNSQTSVVRGRPLSTLPGTPLQIFTERHKLTLDQALLSLPECWLCLCQDKCVPKWQNWQDSCLCIETWWKANPNNSVLSGVLTFLSCLVLSHSLISVAGRLHPWFF